MMTVLTSIALLTLAQPTPGPAQPGSLLTPAALPIPPLPPESMIPRPYRCQIEASPEAAYSSATWPNNTIPYEFATSVTTTNQIVSLNAMNTWAAVSGLTFRAAVASDPSRIRFQSRTDCGAGFACGTSPVGHGNGIRTISIGSCPSSGSCTGSETWNFAVTLHEIGHALGRYHEHQRPDRAMWVAIQQQNYGGSNFAADFDVPGGAAGYGPFDFNSIMAYGACTFSSCMSTCSCSNNSCVVIRALPPNEAQQCTMGTANNLSPLDVLTTRGMYPRAGDRWLRSGSPPSSSGTFFSPYESLLTMYASMPVNGTLFIDPGIYAMPLPNVPQSQPITLRATYGPVTITDAP